MSVHCISTPTKCRTRQPVLCNSWALMFSAPSLSASSLAARSLTATGTARSSAPPGAARCSSGSCVSAVLSQSLPCWKKRACNEACKPGQSKHVKAAHLQHRRRHCLLRKHARSHSSVLTRIPTRRECLCPRRRDRQQAPSQHRHASLKNENCMNLEPVSTAVVRDIGTWYVERFL